jgi:hypothetical protein
MSRRIINKILFQSYYKDRTEKSASELAEYNRKQREKMRRIRARKKTVQEKNGKVKIVHNMNVKI